MRNDILKNSQKLVIDNSPAILTAIGVVGTVSTAFLAGRATVRARDILREEEARIEMMDEPPMTFRDKLSCTWLIYTPPVISCGLTIGAIIGSNIVSKRRAAAVAAAYAIADKAFAEYREKVNEKLGERKTREVQDELAQERVNKNPASKNDILPTKRGDVLCYDTWSGRYFYSEMEELRRSENDINHRILNSYYASLTDYYDRIGLDRTKFSDEIGWNSDELLKLKFSATMSDDGRPCMVVDFDTTPIRSFYRVQ